MPPRMSAPDEQDHGFVSRRAFLQASAAGVLATQVSLAQKSGELTAAELIVKRLAQHGADILFGVPGATCDPLMAAAATAGKLVVTSSDLEAGYAADGFARARGLSAVSVTYGVGTMSLIGVIAGAYAERSPVVVLNGGPSNLDLKLQREAQTLFSHSMGKAQTDLILFKEVTAFAQRAETKKDIPRVVDAAISAALRERRPAYVEIPKDLWTVGAGPAPSEKLSAAPTPSGREAALARLVLEKLAQAKRPVLLLGIELQRYGLAAAVTALVRKLGIPYVTTMLAKAVIPEATPGFAGVYIGPNSVPAVRELVEQSDAVLALGCVFGRQYREVATSKALLSAAAGQVRVGSEGGPADLGALLDELGKPAWTPRSEHAANNPLKGRTFAARRASVAATASGYDQVLGTVSDFLDDTFVVLTDTSLSMYPAADLEVKAAGGFICNAVWQSIGFSVGAALGAALGSGKRPLVLCGDGGFQMTAQALSTMARAGLKSIVIVLDNGLYGIEQYLLEPKFFASPSASPHSYLTLNRWSYAELAKALGFKKAEALSSPAELKDALERARGAAGPVLLSVALGPRELPAQLKKGA
jgi:indolepyruvate decarboxylase